MQEINEKYNLISLLKEYKVVIPLIQRDYAQGRKDKRTTEVRKKLLQDINAALIDTNVRPLDLNFIYGKSSNGKFIPLDGQQRLTTLFLVYLFAYRDNDECDFLGNFSYETRNSSTQFFKSLFENRKIFFTETKSPSEIITDEPWFADSWQLDPTVQGALKTLDDISDSFDYEFDYVSVLSDSNNQKLVFNFLDIDKLGSEDELYIKLNSRGRPLTDFENFKARFIDRIKKLDGHLEREFSHNIDTKWTDVIWNIDKNAFDTNFLNLFEIGLINNLDSLDYSKRDNWTLEIDFETVEISHVKIIISVLDFLSENKMPEVSSILERSIVNKTLKDRIYFHVISTFLEHHGDTLDTSYKNWYRIFKNLIDNSVIESQDPYERAIKGINEQIEHTSDLLEYLAEENRINGFSIEQVDEEIEKAKLITSDDSYREVIEGAEKHRYFDGQIRSCFYFEANDLPSKKIDIISSYWNKISEMFTETKPKEGLLMRTALLSLGDYTVYIGNYKTLCLDNPNETGSLKSLFSSQNEYVKKLLDKIDITKPLDDEYRRIIQENLKNIDQKSWRYAFITYYETMFNKMSPSEFKLIAPKIKEEEMLLIPNKASSGKNVDIHLLALKEKLRELGISSDYYSDQGVDGVRILDVNRGDFIIEFDGCYDMINQSSGTYYFKKSDESNYYLYRGYFVEFAQYLKNEIDK
ncbi:DUF262 domain-containing protein [Streptococcus salivarius]|uniref:DUF262 domain-containing protein n=2 Tax=Streptococcus salivarius TaxID=1304 RepID=UPI0016052352|nr:DUF262 domain-containing protein [Streptococcus salivarius]